MKRIRRRGFSLVEVCIVLAIMSFVTVLAVSLLSLSTHGFNASRQLLDVAMQDADFASRICMAVRESGTSFTIPEQSFTEDKLTAGWNYLGLMKNVEIPASISRTGKEIPSSDALVYIEYAGDEEPASLPMNSVLLHTDDGYFIQTIIGHSYTDVSGVTHNYSLIFSPTEPDSHAAQTISYTFASSAEYGDESHEGSTIETLLEAVNAIQVVYQGSPTNPAVAIAFRSDFIPTLSVSSLTSTKIKGTVVMVLDVSSSMEEGGRINTLKSTAKSFIEELSKNDELNILLTVFSGYANRSSDFNTKTCPHPLLTLANAKDDREQLVRTIDAIKTNSYTNLGDGLRVANAELGRHPEITGYPIFLLVLTDGEVNTCTCVKKKASSGSWGGWGYGGWGGWGSPTVNYTEEDFYYGDEVYSGSAFEDKYVDYYQSSGNLGQKYFQYFGRQLNEKYQPKTYLISMYNGMSKSDKEALKAVFNDTEEFDASSLTQFTEVFNQINQNISATMWAFEGPRI